MNVAEAAINCAIGLGNSKSSSPELAVRAYSPFLSLEMVSEHFIAFSLL